MTNIELLKSPVFALPKKRTIDYFPDYLKTLFQEYKSAIQKFDGKEGDLIKSNLGLIETFSYQIINAIEAYYLGFPGAAYDELKKGLEAVHQFLMIPKENVSIFPSKETLFRVRLGGNRLYRKEEMFHIPFERREFVKTQRYSIPGLPCLYLGNTIYICWEEMRRPDINHLQVSRFEIDSNEFRLLDLSYLPTSFIQGYEMFIKENLNMVDWFMSYIVTWPLMAACSVVTKDDEATFKPEHIIPQLLLQWVCRTHKLDGIKYTSTRAEANTDKSIGAHINYVIPAKEISKEGLCKKLLSKIKLTEPLSWQILNIENPAAITNKTTKEDVELRLKNSLPGIMFIELFSGKHSSYFQTAFGKMEIELCKRDAEKIEE